MERKNVASVYRIWDWKTCLYPHVMRKRIGRKVATFEVIWNWGGEMTGEMLAKMEWSMVNPCWGLSLKMLPWNSWPLVPQLARPSRVERTISTEWNGRKWPAGKWAFGLLVPPHFLSPYFLVSLLLSGFFPLPKHRPSWQHGLYPSNYGQLDLFLLWLPWLVLYHSDIGPRKETDPILQVHWFKVEGNLVIMIEMGLQGFSIFPSSTTPHFFWLSSPLITWS